MLFVAAEFPHVRFMNAGIMQDVYGAFLKNEN